MKYILLLLLPLLAFAQTTHNVDIIQSNDNTDIVINPNGGEVQLPDLTVSRVLELSATGGIISGPVTTATMLFMDATSSIQTQLNATLTDPMTTNGDIIMENTGAVRLGVGTVGQILTVNGGLPSWQDAPVSSPLTTDGDLYYYSTADARLPVGTNGQVLKVTAGLPAWGTDATSTTATVTKVASATLTTAENDVVCTPAADTTLTLPTAVGNNDVPYRISLTTDSFKCVIDANAAETINGVLTIEMQSAGDSIVIKSDGTNWVVFSKDIEVSVLVADDSGQSMVANGRDQVLFNTVTSDKYSWFNAGTDKVSIGLDGLYYITAIINYSAVNAAASDTSNLHVVIDGGATLCSGENAVPFGGGPSTFSTRVNCIVRLTSSDVLKIETFHDFDGSENLTATARYNYWHIVKIGD